MTFRLGVLQKENKYSFLNAPRRTSAGLIKKGQKEARKNGGKKEKPGACEGWTLEREPLLRGEFEGEDA